MCTSRLFSTAVISMPAVTSMPHAAAASVTSGIAATVSWSVTAITVTPARDERSTSSCGVQRPSEAVV
jgi:hypothetical protein